MPSEAAKKRQAKKKAAAQSRGKPKPAAEAAENGVEDLNLTENGAVKLDLSNRSCTGVLASHPQSRDLKVENFSITFHGVELLTDTKLELNCGRRYGLLGLNGCGKFRNIFSLIILRFRSRIHHLDGIFQQMCNIKFSFSLLSISLRRLLEVKLTE